MWREYSHISANNWFSIQPYFNMSPKANHGFPGIKMSLRIIASEENHSNHPITLCWDSHVRYQRKHLSRSVSRKVSTDQQNQIPWPRTQPFAEDPSPKPPPISPLPPPSPAGNLLLSFKTKLHSSLNSLLCDFLLGLRWNTTHFSKKMSYTISHLHYLTEG